MDKENIIKALECCSNYSLLKCNKCPRNNEDAKCMYRLSQDALALIKELDEELEKERTWADSLIDNLRDDIRELTEENRRLKEIE